MLLLSVCAAYPDMTGLRPIDSSCSALGVDPSIFELVTTSSSADPDMMAEDLKQFSQIVNTARSSALGVIPGGAVSAMAGSDCTSYTLAMAAGGAAPNVD